MTATLDLASPQAAWLEAYGETRLLELAGGSDALARDRREALDQLLATPYPTPFHEAWRKTDLSLFPFRNTEPAAPVAEGGQVAAEPWDDAFDVVVVWTSTGLAVQDRSGLLGKGLTLQPLAQADRLHEHFSSEEALPGQDSYFERFNRAFWNGGLSLRVEDGFEVPKGILIRYTHDGGNTLQVPRVLVEMGRGATAKLVELRRSTDPKALTVSSRLMTLAEGSRLTSVSLNDWNETSAHLGSEMARVDRDAKVDMLSINLGSRTSKLDFGSSVAGPGAEADLDGLFFVTGKQHIDQTSLQVHASPDTYSRLLYKGAARDRGHSVYRGVIRANPGAIRVDAYQTNNNIMLSEGARVDTIPGLLIDADDLKCSHGATIGALDEEQLFYLRSRGMPLEEAKHLVLLGFYEDVLERVPFKPIRDWIKERLRARSLKEE